MAKRADSRFFSVVFLLFSLFLATASGGAAALAARRHVGVGRRVLRPNLDAVRLGKEEPLE